MRKFLIISCIVYPFLVLGQVVNSVVSDHNYLEDQLYFGVNYNFMLDYPEAVLKRNFSYGLQGGIIKDLPINTSGTIAFGVGLGYAVNSYYSNLISTKEGSAILYTVPTDDSSYSRSKFETHSIELPLEFRWRNSTATKYKFFRIYSGVKFAYNFSTRSKLVADSGNSGFNNTDIEKLHYGLQLNLGYNTFNLHVYYALNNFLTKGVAVDKGEAIASKPLRVGVIFYLL